MAGVGDEVAVDQHPDGHEEEDGEGLPKGNTSAPT